MSEQRCELTELLVDQCDHCKGQNVIKLPTFRPTGRPRTRASFESECPSCLCTIEVDNEIVLDDGEWVCAECAD